jgi:predicted amidohydrolase
MYLRQSDHLKNLNRNEFLAMDSVKIALGQMYVEPGNSKRNLDKAVEMIRKAARKECQIIVLPECLDLGWTYPESKTSSETIPGPHTDLLSVEAKNHRMYIAAGLAEKCEDELFNSAVLINPNGEIILKHRKINELPHAAQLYSKGQSLQTVSTPLGNIGLTICADNWPDSLQLGHAMGKMGTDILLSPSAWAVKPGHDNSKEPYGEEWKEAYTELALTNKMSVVGVSNVGPVAGGLWNEWNCIGCSLAVDHNGKVLVQGTYNKEEMLFITLNRR